MTTPDRSALRRPFPPSFHFGVASSAFQAEGGLNTGSGPHNNWAEWERTGKAEPSGPSTQFYERYQEHIDLAASLGLTAFRMGVEWARLQPAAAEPAAEPAWDDAALAHYVTILEAVHRAGMEPIVTLHHFTHPAWLPLDFWLTPGAPKRFAAYAARAVAEIGRRLHERTGRTVRYWVTMNEPNLLPLNTYMTQEMPGTGGGVGKTRTAWDALLTGHVLAYDHIHDLYAERGWGAPLVAFNTFCMSIYELDRALYDVVRARNAGVSRESLPSYLQARRAAYAARFAALATRRWGARSVRGLYFAAYSRVCATLFDPLRLTRVIDAVYASPRARKVDYLALDVYDPFLAGSLYFRYPTAARRRSREPTFRPPWWRWKHDPYEFSEIVRSHAEANGDTPIFVMENGIGHRQEKHGHAEPRPDGLTRDVYLTRVFAELRALLDEGLPLAGMLCWTLVDNYEWGSFTTRLGLYDYDHARGVIRDTDGLGVPAGRVYAELVAAARSRDAVTPGATP